MSHSISRRAYAPVFLALLAVAASSIPAAAQIDPSSFAALQWRSIGPFRAGRVSAGAVDPSDSNTYYFGTPGGGVWKSTNAGQTWLPITAPPPSTLLPNVPDYWFAPPAVLTKNRALNRFAWNLRYPNPKILPFGYFGGLLEFIEYTLADHAIPGKTPRDQPEGPLAGPGRYTVELSAGGKSHRQTLVVKADPRIRASEADLNTQSELATRITDALAVTYDAFLSLKELRTSVAARLKALADGKAAKDVTDAVRAFEKKVDAVQTGTSAAPGVGIVNRDLARYYSMLTSGDARPAERLRLSIGESCAALTNALASWRNLNAADVAAVNKALANAKQSPFTPVPVPATPACIP